MKKAYYGIIDGLDLRCPIATICEPLRLLRDRTLLFNEYSRRPFRIRSFNSMPPMTVAGLLSHLTSASLPSHSRRTCVRTSLPRVEMNNLPSSYSTIFGLWLATLPLRLFSHKIRILRAVFSGETCFMDKDAEVPSAKFLSSPIHPDPSSLPHSLSPPLQRVTFSEFWPR